jgi:hypothetical protein
LGVQGVERLVAVYDDLDADFDASVAGVAAQRMFALSQ